LKDDALSKDVGFLPAIGLFGALSSIGLFVHELRGITECYMLIEIGKVLEHKLAKPTEGKARQGGRLARLSARRTRPCDRRLPLSLPAAATG
jgi:hypothetical protein